MPDHEPGGEDALIQAAFAPLAVGFSGALGLRDDCAVLSPPPGEDLVLTTDAVAEGVHFFPDDAPADIAWKALAINVSDLTAKGARPLAYLMAVSFPERPTQSWLDGFTRGLAEAQAAFGIALAGGDTDRRPGPITVTITAIGSVPKGRMVRRATAHAGDVLFLSGTLGDAALGLLVRRSPAWAREVGFDDIAVAHFIARYLRPEPRLAIGPHLIAFASAAMDVSDGLLKDCGRLAHASGLGASIDVMRLPVSPAVASVLERRADLLGPLLAGGDDYEVLAAVPAAHADAFQAACSGSGVAVAAIGRLAAGQRVSVIGASGETLAFEGAGWDHFPH